MLVLTRRVGEKILIDSGRITVEVTQIGGGKTRLAIDAPKDVSVNREEVYDRIKEEGPISQQVVDAEYIKSLIRKMKSDKSGLLSVQKEVQRLILS